jgi:hypothetical protein
MLIVDFGYISRKSYSDPYFFPENEEISAPPPWGFLIGIYKFCEHWSIETFREGLKKKAVCYAYKT